MKEPAGQERRSPDVSKDAESDPKGDHVELTGVSLLKFGSPKDSLLQSCTSDHYREPQLKAKDSQKPSQNPSSGWRNGACSALTSVPSGQLRASDTQPTRVGCSCSVNETRDATLLLKPLGAPEILRASVTEALENHLDELGWRSAKCSYKDGEGPACQTAVTGTRETTGGSSEILKGFRGPSEPFLGIFGIEGMDSSPLREGESLICCSCKKDSENTLLRMEEDAFSPTITKLQLGTFPSVTVADQHPLQKESAGVKYLEGSERLEQRHLLEQVETRQAGELTELDSGISMEGNHQWQSEPRFSKKERQSTSEDSHTLERPPERVLLQQADQENGDRCQQQMGGALLFTVPNSSGTKQKHNSNSPPLGGGQVDSRGDHHRMKCLEHLLLSCQEAYVFLKDAIQVVESSKWPEKPEEFCASLKSYRQMMKAVLDDKSLASLQLEGGVLLTGLKKEESWAILSEDSRDALKLATALYNQVDEAIHQLVLVSNKRIEALELVMGFEEHFGESCSWIDNVGQKRLIELNNLDNSLDGLLQAKKQFQDFALVANEYCQRGWEALRKVERSSNFSAELQAAYRVKLRRHQNQLQKFCSQLEASRSQIEQAIDRHRFLEQAYKWAEGGMQHLASISKEDGSTAVRCLQSYKEQHPEISDVQFQRMKELACQLKSPGALKQWQLAWSKCQSTKLGFEVKLGAALRNRQALCPPDVEPTEKRESLPRSVWATASPLHEKLNRLSGWNRGKGMDSCEEARRDPAKPPCGTCDEKSMLETREATPPLPSTPASGSPRKARSFGGSCSGSLHSSCQQPMSEPGPCGHPKDLAGSDPGWAERPHAEQQLHLGSATLPEASWPEEWRSSGVMPETRAWSSRSQLIMGEMVATEREYVRALRYVLDSYCPEMERVDLPQDLRGKQTAIFGNLEKLHDFHSRYFLRELENCCSHPLRVSHCFLRHKDQFGMYALYSKNKPKSDALLASHGNAFFRDKQRQLEDKMDLASYLLRPIQRMSKYALLLQDLVRQCGQSQAQAQEQEQEQELAYLRAAEEMVRFQLRHGNDLLAMDAIRDCDVNLKEQGQLMRQDEFGVALGRRKRQRCVFLFEDLILFSKPQRAEGGLGGPYVYKHSFKMAEIGLTENSGESGLRFEIWFRRRKASGTYVLQASSPEIKQAWTSDIAKILWEQAARNKEIRLREMLSMGIGNKPFLDIKPSEAAIHNRAIDYIMNGRGARTRASIAVSQFDYANPYKRSPAPPPSGSLSSCSMLGPLNLHMSFAQALLPTVLPTSLPFGAGVCLEEEEAESEASSQPSPTTKRSRACQGLPGSGSGGSVNSHIASVACETLGEDWRGPPTVAADSSLAFPEGEEVRFPSSQYVSAV